MRMRRAAAASAGGAAGPAIPAQHLAVQPHTNSRASRPGKAATVYFFLFCDTHRASLSLYWLDGSNCDGLCVARHNLFI